MPRAALPEESREWAEKVGFQQSVAELEDLVTEARANGSSRLMSPLPAGLAPIVRIYQGHTTMQMWREFSVSQLADVLDKIRNVVLELALEIEAANPDPGEAPDGSMPVEPGRVSQISTAWSLAARCNHWPSEVRQPRQHTR